LWALYSFDTDQGWLPNRLRMSGTHYALTIFINACYAHFMRRETPEAVRCEDG